jgi:protocatechuate 3,4-dioxygenase, alpha subunit
MKTPATTSQTVGPFFSIGFSWLERGEIAGPDVAGERISIAGKVLDGAGAAVPDALLEMWQANAAGKYAHPDDARQAPTEPGFLGFGRVATDGEGRFRFSTIKPGAVPAPDGGMQAPHIAVSVFARGLLRRLVTRIYFADEALNAGDFALCRVAPARRETLIAKKLASQAGEFEWNVILQGSGETVFFDL